MYIVTMKQYKLRHTARWYKMTSPRISTDLLRNNGICDHTKGIPIHF